MQFKVQKKLVSYLKFIYLDTDTVCVCVYVGVFAETPERADEGHTAMTLPSQARFNEHNIRTLKLLEFRLVIQICVPQTQPNTPKNR